MNDNNISIKNLIFLLFFLIAGLVASSVIEGGAKVVKLTSAPAFSGLVAVALQAQSQHPTTLPKIDKDFSLSSQYFDKNQWVVVSIRSTNNSFDPSVLVLENKEGVYQITSGPSGAFTQSQLSVLPGDVATYLSQGGTYEVIPE
jgi:hypothetical protein